MCAALLLSAVLLGGGGTPDPLAELILQFIVAGAIALTLMTADDRVAWSKSAIAVGILVLAIPLIQIIPLPSSVWQAIPGAGVRQVGLESVSAGQSWRPVSLAPYRTLASLLAIASAVAMMLLTVRLTRADRTMLLTVLIVSGLLTTVLGAFQVATGEAAPRLYDGSHHGWITGFFANRNAAADLLLIALCALIAVARDRAHAVPRAVIVVAAILLVAGVVFTASRAGIALLTVPALMAAFVLARPDRGAGRAVKVVGGLAALGALAVAAAVLIPGRLQTIAQRYTQGDTTRESLWADTLYAIGQFWPTGSGIGTFVPTFIALEPLESVDASLPNRAHNDWLEFTLEAGALWLLALAAIAILAWQAWLRWKRHDIPTAHLAFALSGLTIVALHSLVDYPLRTMTLGMITGMMAGFLFAVPRNFREEGNPMQKRDFSEIR